MKKVYVVAKYGNGLAMFESKMVKGEVVNGYYKGSKEVVGSVNGFEKGIFTAENGERYLVFKDNTVTKL